MPLRGPQLAYYMKKRDPELYRKAKELKEMYGVTWDEAFAILRGEKKPPTATITTGSELQVTVNDVVKRVEALERRVSELGKLYTDLVATSTKLNSAVNMLSAGLDRRFRFKEYYCVFIDDEGYCKAFYWTTPLKDYKMKEVVESGKKGYYVNVKIHRWFCALCPRYAPKYLAESLDDLRSRQGALELELESLKAQVAQLQQTISQKSVSESLEKIRESLERLERELKF
jgi:phage-related protein